MKKEELNRKKDNAELVAELLKVLAHPTRLMIICLIKEKEFYAQELLDILGTTKGNISQHMKILLDHHIVEKRDESNRTYYRIADEKILALVETMEKNYCSVERR